ncbi:MAG: alpha/beta hydrolase fold protein, partial [Pseudomonas sp.]|nr:alpha/beta hydrolase fold protein [Pseudomonas sp.]
MTQKLTTRYPLVMVPGLLGFVRLVIYPYWFGIVKAMRLGGATVFPVMVSAVNSTEVRGEQLLLLVEQILR